MKTATRISPQSLTQLPRPGRNPAYVRWIRSQPCSVSGRNWNIEAAHTGPHALGRKADDLSCIPLHRDFHTRKPFSYHVLGRGRFEEVHGISVEQTIQYLQALAIANGISLEPLKRKGLGRAGQVKRDIIEGAA